MLIAWPAVLMATGLAKVPSPLPSITIREAPPTPPSFVTARSRKPSPLKSPLATPITPSCPFPGGEKKMGGATAGSTKEICAAAGTVPASAISNAAKHIVSVAAIFARLFLVFIVVLLLAACSFLLELLSAQIGFFRQSLDVSLSFQR